MSLITKQLLSRLPKTELHLHLDGSLPFEFILKRAVERNILLPATTSQELRNYIHDLKTKARKIDPKHTQMAGKNWGVFDWCNQFLQTKEELKDAASLICKNIERDHNVKRVELRFCPTLHTLEGLTPKEAVEAVVEGVPDTGGVIICALRSNDAQHSLEMAQLTIETNNQTNGKVCGFDIAGDEGSYPLHIHQESIKLCKTNQIPVTVSSNYKAPRILFYFH
jgi:adenosine deaminase